MLFSLSDFMVMIYDCILPLRKMLIAFLQCFLATNNMSVASWGEYEILMQKENIRKKLICFVCFEMLLYCIPVFSVRMAGKRF